MQKVPWAGKMTQILHQLWLATDPVGKIAPTRPLVNRKKNLPEGLFLVLFIPNNKCLFKLGLQTRQSPATLTARLINNPNILQE